MYSKYVLVYKWGMRVSSFGSLDHKIDKKKLKRRY